MAGTKRKKEELAAAQLPQAAGSAGARAGEAQPAAQHGGTQPRRQAIGGYSTAGIASKTDAQSALAGARYRPSQYVQDAAQALRDWQQSRPTDYASAYQAQIDTLLGQLTGREPFRYDYGSDPLYQQYARLYTQNARLASEDAAAQAAALTGGYGSSYAASAAQQAYQQQMDELNAVVPTLYAQALDEYNSQGQALYDQLAAYSAQEQADQARYYEDMGLYNSQLGYLTDAYNTAYAQDYGAYSDHLDALAGLRDYYASQEQYEAAQAQQAWENQMAERKYADAQAQQAWENQMEEKQYQLAVQKAAAGGASSGGSGSKAKAASGGSAAPAGKAAAGQTAEAATPRSVVEGKLNGVRAALSSSVRSPAALEEATLAVPYSAARAKANGQSDAVIRRTLRGEGYTDAQIETILRQL